MGYDDIFSQETLIRKAQELKTRGFKPGFDGMDADALVVWLTLNGQALLKQLRNLSYIPMPGSGFRIAKISGSYRQLSKLTAIDSVICYCLLETVEPILEQYFSDNSFAYRPGRGVHAALKRYCQYASEHPFAIKIDPKACFDNINRLKLREKLAQVKEIGEYEQSLIWKFINMPLYDDGQINHTEKGILQGSPLSPLLCNIYMDSLDKLLLKNQIPFVRYADDTIMFADSAEHALEIDAMAKRHITEELLLQIHERKCSIGPSTACSFLNNRFERDRYGLIRLKSENTAEGIYYSWHTSRPERTHKRLDVLSDGILRQKDYSLQFESDTSKVDLPVNNINMINIYSNVIFDSGFLNKVFDNGLYVNIFGKYGDLLGQFIPFNELKSPQVTFEMLTAYNNEEQRMFYAKQFVLAALHNLRLVIRYYNKYKPEDYYAMVLDDMSQHESKIKSCEDYDKLLMYEAGMRKDYYSCFDFFIRDSNFIFDKRTRQPPRSNVNAMISFGNTVLYNLIAVEINKSPLDIRIGFLHSTNGHRRQSLNLDVAEVFKPLIIDRTVMTIINKRMITPTHFYEESNGGIYLSNEGKRIFIRTIYEKLDETLTIDSVQFSYSELIREEIRKLVRSFKDGIKYKAYRQVR